MRTAHFALAASKTVLKTAVRGGARLVPSAAAGSLVTAAFRAATAPALAGLIALCSRNELTSFVTNQFIDIAAEVVIFSLAFGIIKALEPAAHKLFVNAAAPMACAATLALSAITHHDPATMSGGMAPSGLHGSVLTQTSTLPLQDTPHARLRYHVEVLKTI